MPYEPLRHHPRQYNTEDMELARKFSRILKDELKEMLCDVVFFGSAAKNTAHEIYGSDIDVLVIIDDRTKQMSEELAEGYRIIAKKAAAMTSLRLHINTLRMSGFFEYALNGDPIATNILKDGIPMLNQGFFETLQHLSSKGKVQPNREIIWAYYHKAPISMLAAKGHIMMAVMDLYWACLNATHSMMQKFGEVPYTPEHTIEILKSRAKEFGIPLKNIEDFAKIRDAERRVANREIQEMSGKEYDELRKKAKTYLDAVNAVTTSMPMRSKIE